MTGHPVVDVLKSNKILPIIVIDDLASAGPTFDALLTGGLQCAEITLRTAAGLSVIETVSKNFPSILVGAGTVLTPLQVRQAHDAGASFIVSPGFDEDVLKSAQALGIPYFPGTATATEIQRVMRSGITLVKFFPSEQLGGIAAISAISSALSAVEFMPSGGVSEENFISYLKHPKVSCVGGSWMVSRQDIQQNNFSAIKEKVRSAVFRMQNELSK